MLKSVLKPLRGRLKKFCSSPLLVSLSFLAAEFTTTDFFLRCSFGFMCLLNLTLWMDENEEDLRPP